MVLPNIAKTFKFMVATNFHDTAFEFDTWDEVIQFVQAQLLLGCTGFTIVSPDFSMQDLDGEDAVRSFIASWVPDPDAHKSEEDDLMAGI